MRSARTLFTRMALALVLVQLAGCGATRDGAMLARDWQEALDRGDLDHVLRATASELKHTPGSVDALRFRGLAWSGKGLYEKAVLEYSRAIDGSPTPSAELHRLRGAAQQALGRLDRAIDDFERALALEPGDVATRECLAAARTLQTARAGS